MDISWRKVGAAAAIWAAVALFFSLQNAVGYVVRGEEVDWLRAVGVEFLYWVPWALLTPPLLFVVRRFPLAGPSWRRHLAVQGGAAVAVSVVQVLGFDLLQLPLFLARTQETASVFVKQAGAGFPVLALTAFWKYWVIVGLYYAFDYYRKYRDREVRASRLEAELSRAQLQALKMKIQPHFLFNTLHSVSMLNLTDTEAANRVLVKLSRLLRETLDSGDDQEVSLTRELELVDRYLEIESLRFGDRLRVKMTVESGLEDARVPSLVLQPLVENAVRHGVEARAGAGSIEIRAGRRSGKLLLEVLDDGPGIRDGWSLDQDAGIGLRTTAARLEGLYGDASDLDLEPRQDGGGTRATVLLPLRIGAGT